MSVINKVLRDLDQRQDGLAGRPARQAGAGEQLTRGTVALARSTSTVQPGSRKLQWAAGTVALVAVAGMTAWYWPTVNPTAKPVVQLGATSAAPESLVAAVVFPAGSSPVSVPATVPSRRISMPEQVREQKAPPLESKAVLQGAVAKARIPSDKASAESAEKAAPALPTLNVQGRASIAADTTGDEQLLRMDSLPLRLPSNVNTAQDVVVRSINDLLAQAQALWNSGTHAAAIVLLQQALSQAELASPVATVVTGQSTLARLARELARLSLAEGQVGQALALLTRLEPQLSQIADLWAMRGNAAQRLGQHEQAVKCYQQALLLHPDEPRWMSGEAVSLAAQGQLAAAGELAEKTRVLGALRPEIATYLRQLGVTVRMD